MEFRPSGRLCAFRLLLDIAITGILAGLAVWIVLHSKVPALALLSAIPAAIYLGFVVSTVLVARSPRTLTADAEGLSVQLPGRRARFPWAGIDGITVIRSKISITGLALHIRFKNGAGPELSGPLSWMWSAGILIGAEAFDFPLRTVNEFLRELVQSPDLRAKLRDRGWARARLGEISRGVRPA